ncbi:hypothetical protein EJ08DRAFT_701968 [Tothia fuscella]|uniref:BZIP domain-containing protein n=1 Tax=Tothia fuscella TaxID=1048955 RepID=A0A9P4TU18_9PEZI|nr:hypothetical protein EJ08DRAFT_701968 [Tothia fuscella]
MEAEKFYPNPTHHNDRSSSSKNNDNSYSLFDLAFEKTITYSEPPSDTLQTMNAAVFPMQSSMNNPMGTDGFNGVDGNLWGSHNMDFSAFAPPNPWVWANNQRGSNILFDVRNGLTTPPKDDLPPDMATTNLDSINPNEIVNSRKRSSRKMSRGGNGADDEERSTNSGRKSRKGSKVSLIDPEEGEEGEEKREKFLERNRVAASKCRQKKKVWTHNLEERARELTSERHALTHHVALLRNELLELKCKCLEHTNCDCLQIREYLKNTVAALQPANRDLYVAPVSSLGLSTSSTSVAASASTPSSASTSNGNVFSPRTSVSRVSSSTTDSSLHLLKLEDESVRTTLANSMDPAHGGNGLKN